MKKIKSIKKMLPVWLLMAVAVLTSCHEEYLSYDTDYSGVYFTSDTLRYSFGVTSVDIREYEYRIPVSLMGTPAGTDRTFSYSIDKGTTAVDGVQCTIGEPVIEADSIRGYIPVMIHRDALEGDYINGYERYNLVLRLMPDASFVPTLSPKEQVIVLVFDNAVEQPNWLDYKGDKVWDQYGVWHPLKFIKMVEYFHELEHILPDSYKNMVEEYGENLEHVEFGSFYKFQTIMNKYVFYPMYLYFSDPDNEDEILALYPDFPFDFPNPF